MAVLAESGDVDNLSADHKDDEADDDAADDMMMLILVLVTIAMDKGGKVWCISSAIHSRGAGLR